MEGDNLILRFGTSEPPAASLRLVAGPLALEIVGGAARNVRWHGVEMVRAIECLVRDESWGTYPAEAPHDEVSTGGDGFSFERSASIAGGALTTRVTFAGKRDGSLSAFAELTAHRDLRTNRAGFTVLHPIGGLAGSRLTVTHPGGSASDAQFPRLISPAQPVFDIAGLDYARGGIEASIRFSGEAFEMEDQRNWTDASYKTYCRPLARPHPYTLREGECVRQSVELRLRGGPAGAPDGCAGSAGAGWRAVSSGEAFPRVCLALDESCLPAAEECGVVRLAAVDFLRLRVRPETLGAVFAHAAALLPQGHAEVELEIVIPRGKPMDDCLARIAEQTARHPLAIRRVIALPEDYLRNFQPEGPWPEGPSPRDAALAARRAFPGARIGGGVLTHFTEFNRCRPDLSACDYVTHGTCAILHSASDRVVMQNLEGLEHVFASARALAAQREYHLGLVSIGMRTNPHGSDVAPNPLQVRMVAAGSDPRQRGLFAAAWATGAMAATAGHAVSSIALAAPVGPLGLVHRPKSGPPVLHPLFHVVRALAEIGNRPRFFLPGLPEGLVGVAAAGRQGVRALIANVGKAPCALPLPPGTSFRCLDEASFHRASENPNWLCDEAPRDSAEAVLSPYSVAFLDIPALSP